MIWAGIWRMRSKQPSEFIEEYKEVCVARAQRVKEREAWNTRSKRQGPCHGSSGFGQFLIFKNIYLFLKVGRKGRDTSLCEREISITSLHVPNRGLACNSGMCPDRKLNWQPFGLWDDAQPIEPHLKGVRQFLIAGIVREGISDKVGFWDGS